MNGEINCGHIPQHETPTDRNSLQEIDCLIQRQNGSRFDKWVRIEEYLNSSSSFSPNRLNVRLFVISLNVAEIYSYNL